jgi:pyruvate/2-oxoglutarate dehydrogenase complex dihydrolipoamide dehydrogenase (E3) component
MEEILASGKADVIELARALVADPMLPRKVTENRPEDIVYCLRCLTCLSSVMSTRRANAPSIPRSDTKSTGWRSSLRHIPKRSLSPAAARRLEAALTAARRGHKVVLCEKADEVGGILVGEQAIPFKREMYKLAGTLKKLAEDAGAEIRLSTEVTPELVKKEAPDVLIVAAGSSPLIPAIPGIDGRTVVFVTDFYKEKGEIGQRVVILGGGMAGCELAIHLNREGRHVELVEMMPELAPDAPLRHRPLLIDELNKGVVIHTETTGVEITKDGLTMRDTHGEKRVITADSIIIAAGQRARHDVADALADTAPYVMRIGDCVRPATITQAISEGYHAALDI